MTSLAIVTSDIQDRVATALVDYDRTVQQAQQATKAQELETTRSAVRVHYKAVLWSMLLSTTL